MHRIKVDREFLIWSIWLLFVPLCKHLKKHYFPLWYFDTFPSISASGANAPLQKTDQPFDFYIPFQANQHRLFLCRRMVYHQGYWGRQAVLGHLTETWWNHSHDWRAGMEGYKHFRRDGQGRRSSRMALCVRQCFDVEEQNAWNDNIGSLGKMIRTKANKAYILVGVCHGTTRMKR